MLTAAFSNYDYNKNKVRQLEITRRPACSFLLTIVLTGDNFKILL